MKFGSLSGFWMCKEHSCPLSPYLGLSRTLEVSEWNLAFWSWFGYGHWSLIYLWSKFWLSILILKVQRTFMSFKSSFWALEVAGGFWQGLGILILIWIWSLVFDTIEKLWGLYTYKSPVIIFPFCHLEGANRRDVLNSCPIGHVWFKTSLS